MISVVSDIDLIISTDCIFPQINKENIHKSIFNDINCFIQNTLVIYSYKGRYGCSKLILNIDNTNRIMSFYNEDIGFKDKIPDSPKILELLRN